MKMSNQQFREPPCSALVDPLRVIDSMLTTFDGDQLKHKTQKEEHGRHCEVLFLGVRGYLPLKFFGQVNYGVNNLNAAVWSVYTERSVNPLADAVSWKKNPRLSEEGDKLTGSVRVLSFSKN